MLQVTRPNQKGTVTCPFDNTTSPAKFEILECMDVDKRLEINSLLQNVKSESGEFDSRKMMEFHKLVIKKGLLGLHNVLNVDGNPIVMNGEGVTDETLADLFEVRLPGSGYENLASWLGGEIWKRTSLTEDAKKLRLAVRAIEQDLIGGPLDFVDKESDRFWKPAELEMLVGEWSEVIWMSNLIRQNIVTMGYSKLSSCPGILLDCLQVISGMHNVLRNEVEAKL